MKNMVILGIKSVDHHLKELVFQKFFIFHVFLEFIKFMDFQLHNHSL